jgi:histidinol phosphatase-like enzyme (inositol monophosphatase family)
MALRHFGGIVPADSKEDGSPVTPADRAIESFLRQGINSRFPSHGVLGEEFGEQNPGADVRWILDPIDGTLSFMRGVPLFGILIGVEVGGEPSVGVVHLPALGETVSAALGHGCRWNGRPATVSTTSGIADAVLLTTDPRALQTGPMAKGWNRLVGAGALVRGWGDCYGHVLVATGRADVMVDPVLSTWDAAPFLPILTEAGGRFTDSAGRARYDGGSGISTNGWLHGEVLRILGS